MIRVCKQVGLIQAIFVEGLIYKVEGLIYKVEGCSRSVAFWPRFKV